MESDKNFYSLSLCWYVSTCALATWYVHSFSASMLRFIVVKRLCDWIRGDDSQDAEAFRLQPCIRCCFHFLNHFLSKNRAPWVPKILFTSISLQCSLLSGKQCNITIISSRIIPKADPSHWQQVSKNPLTPAVNRARQRVQRKHTLWISAAAALF